MMLVTNETVDHYLTYAWDCEIKKLWECLTDIPDASKMTVSELRRLIAPELIERMF